MALLYWYIGTYGKMGFCFVVVCLFVVVVVVVVVSNCNFGEEFFHKSCELWQWRIKIKYIKNAPAVQIVSEWK